MFTGIVRHVGSVKSVRPSGGGSRLAIDLGPLAEGLRQGDSVAVNGACLTATDLQGAAAEFDVISETLSHTTLGTLRPGAKVNLERALAAGDTLDGHLVQGHIDGTAAVRTIKHDGQWTIEFSAQAELLGQMVSKGSVTIDGVSLTLANVSTDRFSVALIPTTLADTTLANLTAGVKVNVETDVIGKYVLRYLQQIASGQAGGGLSLEALRQAGFM